MTSSLRISLPTALVTSLLLGLVLDYVVEHARIRENTRRAAEDELRQVLSVGQAVLETAFRTRDEGRVQEALTELNLNPRIVRAALLDHTDTVVAATRMALLGSKLGELVGADPRSRDGIARSRSTRLAQFDVAADGLTFWSAFPIRLASTPATLGSSQIGVLYAEFDLAAVAAAQAHALGTRDMLLASLILLIALALGIFIHFRVTRRIESLVQFADHAAGEGGLPRTGVSGQDEIGHLARSLEQMLEQRRSMEADRVVLATAFQQAADPAFVCTSQGIITLANDAVSRVFGLTPEQIIGQTPKIFSSGLHDRVFFTEMWGTITRGEVWSGRVIDRTASDELVELDYTISPILGASGEPVEFFAYGRDVTKQVALEQQLLQSQKLEAVGLLAGGLAHDFNNLLTVIIGSIDLVRMDRDDPRLTPALEAAGRATVLTRQLLEFGRKTIAQPQVMDLNPVVEETRRMLERLIGANIDLSVCLDEPLWMIRADPTQLQQVIINLAINARDAMPSGGQLSILTANVPGSELPAGSEDQVQLIVSDSGTGIDPSIRELIFDPFFSTKPVGKGTGLGLSTVHGIVTAHGGSIDVVDRASSGGGTSFRIHLPRVAEEVRDDIDRRPETGTAAADGGLILVVEDGVDIRQLISSTLRGAGYQVLCAASAEEALQLAAEQSQQLTLLLSDVVLAGMGGPELAEVLRRSQPELRVLFISGHAPVEAMMRIGSESSFLPKPFGLSTLLEQVAAVLAAAGRLP